MTSRSTSPSRVALVGAGTVGTAVAYLLAKQGHEIVGVSSRTSESSQRASDRLGAPVFGADDLPAADLVLIGAPDDAIESVATHIAPRVAKGSLVAHFAGAFGPSLLSAVRHRAASACAIHPVQACPSVDAAIARLPGSAWGVTCSNATGEERMIELIRKLEGTAIVLPEELRPTWHAAASMTSNGIAALLAASESLLAGIGVDDPIGVLGPLAAGTVQNVRELGGGAAALTGPVVRGDVETLKRHMETFREPQGAHRMRYQMVVSLIVQAALQARRIDGETANKVMRAVLD